jgi:phosphatidate cytidylyltransferase
MSELKVRTIAGAAMILVALAAEFLGGTAFAILVALAATAIYYEWTRIVRGWGIGWNAGGFAYALIAALALLWVRERGGEPGSNIGHLLVVWVFIVTWASDIGAFFVGRAVGGPKLAPTISPNKTVAGFLGGVSGATLLAGIWVILNGIDPAWLILAPLFSVAAQGGDLFESWMKRRAGVKDSGRWLPGHGGVFDRLDGLLPVAILTALAVVAGVA